MKAILRKFKGWGKLAVATILMVLLYVGVAGAVIITHVHDQQGTTEQSTDIPIWAKWRLKVQAPTSGLIRAVFIDDGHFNWCGESGTIRDGESACG